MVRRCCSAHRCCSIACATCAWRYSLPVTRRILSSEPRSLHALAIAGAASSPAEFRYWRKAVRNALAYQRRRSRWWRSVGIWAWWDGLDLRGIVSLGSITTPEFMVTLQRHGEVHMRPIAIETVRAEVYAAAMSISAASFPKEPGRYQPFKIAIEPVTAAQRTVPTTGNILVEPLPIIF